MYEINEQLMLEEFLRLQFSSLIIPENGSFLCLNNQAKRAISNCRKTFKPKPILYQKYMIDSYLK